MLHDNNCVTRVGKGSHYLSYVVRVLVALVVATLSSLRGRSVSGREASAPELSLDLHPSEVSTSLSLWLHPSTLARMRNLYRLQWRTHCNDRCGDSFHADGSAFPELFSWANLSTSTRISSLTLYTVNKAVNTTERTESFTCCGNRDFQDTTLMSRD
jgi:hypothetical protein